MPLLPAPMSVLGTMVPSPEVRKDNGVSRWRGFAEVMGEKLRLMAVHAHPDDESSTGAATMAKYVAEGHEVMVVTCTGGERGDILNPAMDRPEVAANLPAIRREEMAMAAEI